MNLTALLEWDHPVSVPLSTANCSLQMCPVWFRISLLGQLKCWQRSPKSLEPMCLAHLAEESLCRTHLQYVSRQFAAPPSSFAGLASVFSFANMITSWCADTVSPPPSPSSLLQHLTGDQHQAGSASPPLWTPHSQLSFTRW